MKLNSLVGVIGVSLACSSESSRVSIATGDTTRVTSEGDGEWGPSHDAVEVLRVSGEDKATSFGQIRYLSATRNGGVIAFDYKGAEGPIVRQFDANGAFVRNIGRAGGGPGEYNTSNLMIFEQANGTILIRDEMRAVNRYSSDGGFINGFALISGGGYAGIVGGPDNSIYIPATYGRDVEMPGGRTPIIRYDSTGQALDTIQPGPTWLRSELLPTGHAALHPSQFRAQELWLVLQDGRTVIARTDKVAILVRNQGGAAPMISERVAVPIAFSDEEKKQWRDAERSGRGHGEPAAAPTEIPSFKLPVVHLQADVDDRIWLSIAAQAVQIEPRCVRSIENVCVAKVSYGEPPVRAAFQADGKYLGEVRFPLGASHITTSGQFAWAVIHDDDGVPGLAKYRLY